MAKIKRMRYLMDTYGVSLYFAFQVVFITDRQINKMEKKGK